jgi:hypothetical protein
VTHSLRTSGLTALLLIGLSPCYADCRQALALGLDVSGSVDRKEYSLQLNGLAHALRQPAVKEAILAFPDTPVRLYVYQWSSMTNQTEILPWTEISDEKVLENVAVLLETPKARPRSAETAVGAGMLFGAMALASQRDCWRLTIDISGDGKSNTGPRPRDVNLDPIMDGITVNGLVVGIQAALVSAARSDSVQELSAFYHAEVIRGPDAFVEVALGYMDYARAMEKKLLRELQVKPVGQLIGTSPMVESRG